MIVSLADAFEELRSNRPYRRGLATARLRVVSDKDSPAFNQTLLKRFVTLIH